MKISLTSILFFFGISLYSQIFFDQGNEVCSSCNEVDEIVSFDLDNDGDIDIVYSSFILDKIVWIENTGDRQFTREQILLNLNVSRIKIADFNLDGLIDIFYFVKKKK